MALLEFGAQTILKYRADVSDAKKGLRELQGEEKKLAQERIKAQEAENEALKKRAERFGFVAAAIGATMATVALAKSGMEEYGKTSDEAAEKVARIERAADKAMSGLQASIGKTVVQLEPLITGVAKLVSLLNEAGASGPLAMGALAYAISGNPVIAAIAEMGASGGRSVPTGIGVDVAGGGALARFNRSAIGRRLAAEAKAPEIPTWRELSGAIRDGVAGGVRRVFGIDEWGGMPKPTEKGAPRPGRWGDVAEQPFLDYTDFGDRIGRPTASTGLLGARSESSLVDQFGRSIDPLDQFLKEQVERNTQSWNERLAAAREKRTSFLESTFGPIEEFNLYGKAFETLTGGVTSAMDAWITGSASATDAIKAFLAETIKGLAIQMTVEAIKHGAYALGSLAFGDAKGAASHGMAAAKFAAGAVIATGLAKGMYGAGWAGGESAGAGANPGAPSTGGAPAAMQPAAPTHVVVYEDSFADASAHERQLRAERTIRRVSGSRAVRDR